MEKYKKELLLAIEENQLLYEKIRILVNTLDTIYDIKKYNEILIEINDIFYKIEENTKNKIFYYFEKLI